MRKTKHMGQKQFRARAAFAGAAAAIALAMEPAAADFESGLSAYQKGDFEVAIDFWRNDDRDVRSMKALGDFYSHQPLPVGADNHFRVDQIEQNRKQAPDYVEALKWYTLAAHFDLEEIRKYRPIKADEVSAQLDAGLRIPQVRARVSNAEADEAEDLIAAAYQGSGSDLDVARLAEMFLRGDGVRKDNVRAYELYTVAKMKGVGGAPDALQRMRDDRIVSAKEIARAERRAQNWVPTLPALLEGDTPADKRRSRQIAQLETLRRDKALQAVADIEVSAIQQALSALGLYKGAIDNVEGRGTIGAIKKFQYARAIQDPSLTASERKYAETGTLSAEQTVDLIERAAVDEGDKHAQYTLGIMYLREIGVLADGREAVKWLTASASQNNAFAHYALCVVFRDGTTGLNAVTPNALKAASHCSQSEHLGYPQGGRALDQLLINPYEAN